MSNDVQDVGVERLVTAIVGQAAADYTSALRYLRHHPSPEFLRRSQLWVKPSYRDTYNSHKRNKEDCEHFFASDWYKQLTSVNGEVVRRMSKEKSFERMRKK